VELIGRRHSEVSLGLRIFFALCWGLLSVLTPPAKAQNSRGTILGHVQDASPAPVAGAKVTVSNVDTGVRNKFTTAAAGDYVFVNLVPGTYSITIEKDGFKSATSSGLILEVDQTLRQDVTLQVGSAKEEVTVSADSQLVQTDNTTTGNVLDERFIEELPSNGRDFTNLLNLSAGATNLSGGIQATGFVLHGLSSFTEVSLNGARPDSISYLVDGVTDNDSFFSGASNVPTEFSLQEVKIQSGLYSAEYGQGSATVNVAIKSGTNQWHGQAYEFIQNDAFQPKSPLVKELNILQNSNQPLKTPFKQNQFGGTLGGPVTIPLLYHGQNKSFWFFAYDGGRRRTTSNTAGAIQVPTLAERGGDFSDWPFPIYDPTTRGTQPVTAANPLGASPFPGNKIPSGRISAIGQRIANLYPAPNINCTFPCNNFVLPVVNSITTNNETFRVDQNFGQKDRIYFTGHVRREDQPNPSQLPFTGSTSLTNSSLFGWNWEHTFGSNTVNSARFGINRQFYFSALDTAFGTDLSAQLGLQNTPTNPANFGIPAIQLNQGYSSIGGGSGGTTTGTRHQVYQWVDNLKLIRGRHTITTGFDIRLNRDFEADDFLGTGSLNFNGNYTALTPVSGGGTGAGAGNPVADLILGYPVSVSAPPPLGTDLLHVTGTNYNLFAQDDFRVTPRLTINLGLRYELPPDYHSTTGGGFTLDPNNGGSLIFVNRSFVNSVTTPQTNPSLLNCCAPNTLVPIDKKDFAPRIGLAWRPFDTNRFVVRAGYGIFYDTYNRYFDLIQSFNDPQIFSLFSNPNYPTPTGQENTASCTTCLPLNTLFFPNVTSSQFFTIPSFSPNLANTTLNQTEYPFNHNPYNQQWTLDTQFAITQSVLLDIGYVGSHGLRLPTQNLLNAAFQPKVPDPCDVLFDRSQATGSNANCATDPNFSPVDQRVPFPGLPSVVYANQNTLSSNYNSLQVQVRQRFSHGLTYQIFYTFSKALDDASGINNINGLSEFIQDPHNTSADKGPASFDQPHRLVGSGFWELPVGQGKHWSAGPANWVVGGWRIAGIYTLTSGRTYTVYPFGFFGASDFTGSNFTGRYRADLVGDPNSGFTRGYSEYFNTSAFAAPAPGLYGNEGKGILRGPYVENLDLSFEKKFQFTERHNLQYRLEIFNVGSNWHSVARIPDNNLQDNNYGFLGPNNGAGSLNLYTPRLLQMSLVYSF
jgi:Carboxypeptidase regulatory-like domain/TonB dependent receptor-like, beta-barrel/TonB-dependent Receptor Plug Domain